MRKGFTLIELVISIALFALVLLGVAGLFSRGITVGLRAEKLTVAVNLAQAQIETILAAEYSTLNVGAFEQRHIVFETFERDTEINYIDPDTLDPTAEDLGLKRARVTVFYPAPGGEKTFTLSTIVTE